MLLFDILIRWINKFQDKICILKRHKRKHAANKWQRAWTPRATPNNFPRTRIDHPWKQNYRCESKQNYTSEDKNIRNKNKTSMASNLSPEFAYTVLYVKNVAESVAFYSKAFGYSVRRLDESHRLFSFFSFSSSYPN